MMCLLSTRVHALTLAAILLGCSDPAPSGDAGVADPAPDASSRPARCSELALDVPRPFTLDDPEEAQCALEAVFKDLPPDAVVCSGEDSHGIVESSAVHGIVLAYLMRAHGTRTLLLEDSDAWVSLLDEYLATGDESLLTAYFEPYVQTAGGTNEGVAFIRQVRELSMMLGDGDRLHIRGIDVAGPPGSAVGRLLAYFSKADSTVAEAMRSVCPDTRGPETTVAVLSSGAAYLDEVIAAWDGKRDGYIASTDIESTELAYADLLDLRDGYRFLMYYLMDDFATGDALYREPTLERNLLRFAARAAERKETIMVIAHNTHCAHGTEIGNSPSLGSRVSGTLRSRYVVLGQSYGHGTQRDRKDAAGTFGDAPVGVRGTWAASVAKMSKLPQFIMLPSQPGYVGDAKYIEEYGYPIIPSRDFDAIVFLSEVTASTTFMP